MLSGVEQAYVFVLVKRETYVELPVEDAGYQEVFVGRSQVALYGTRDVASLWQDLVAAFCSRSIWGLIVLNTAAPTRVSFITLKMDLRCFVHGKDSGTSGLLENLAWMRAASEGEFRCENDGCRPFRWC